MSVGAVDDRDRAAGGVRTGRWSRPGPAGVAGTGGAEARWRDPQQLGENLATPNQYILVSQHPSPALPPSLYAPSFSCLSAVHDPSLVELGVVVVDCPPTTAVAKSSLSRVSAPRTLPPAVASVAFRAPGIRPRPPAVPPLHGQKTTRRSSSP